MANTINPEKSQSKFSSLRLFRTSLLYQTKEFFNNSTLHGVRYIAETGRPFGEKFMWFCFTVTGAIAALIIIVSLWEKFQTNPTITGLDTDFHNQQVVFPTVSVCPTETYDTNSTRQISYSLAAGDSDIAEIFNNLLQELPSLTYSSFEKLYKTSLNLSRTDINLLNKKSLRSLVFEINIECEEVFDTCKYKDEEIQCCDHFFPVYSENGFCYAFNPRYFDRDQEEEENDDFHDMYETDKKWALFFRPRKQSYIYLHSHVENFGWDFRPQILWNALVAEILISMKQTYTTEDAKQLSIVQRKCIFPDEVKLEIYSDEYTFTSCMKECRINKCIKYCKCIPPFYKVLDKAPTCTIEQFKCLSLYMANITNVKDCQQCELSCLNTVYDIEKLSITGADAFKPDDIYVNIEYLTWPIIRYKREVLFGWVDLLVSFGGIAGLFLGFSLLSGVEIIYYFTMRACCMLYKNRDELCTIEEEKAMQTQRQYDLTLKPHLDRGDNQKNNNIINVKSAGNGEKNVEKKENEFLRPIKTTNRASPKLFLRNNRVAAFNKNNQIKANNYDFETNSYGGYVP